MKNIIEKINESVDTDLIRKQANEYYTKYQQAKMNKNTSLTKLYKSKMEKLTYQLDKSEYGADDVIKVLKKLGYSPTKSSSTAIRGFRNYTKGYEYNRNNALYIEFHAFRDEDIDKISDALKNHPNVDNISKSGISLKKSK